MDDSLENPQNCFKQLRLTETAIELPNLFRKAEQESWTYRELVQEMVQFELKKREEKRMKWAKFPYFKTMREFNLSD